MRPLVSTLILLAGVAAVTVGILSQIVLLVSFSPSHDPEEHWLFAITGGMVWDAWMLAAFALRWLAPGLGVPLLLWGLHAKYVAMKNTAAS